MFRPNSLYYSDGYKVGHKRMLASGTLFLYGTWIPRTLKYAPKGVKKVVSFGQQLTWRWLHDEFEENFFKKPWTEASQFIKDMSLYLGMNYDGVHFETLHTLGYLPLRIKSLPEGIETEAGIPHMTFINTLKGFGWLTLYVETVVSSLAWKSCTSATIALQYKRNAINWVKDTDKDTMWLVPFMCHDFSARGLSPFDMLSSGLGHASSFRGSDTLICIPGARYFYNEPEDQVCINSVNASEHSVSTTKIFTVGEQQMISDWMKDFPEGILSIVSDTFDLWQLITKFLVNLKDEILSRNGKLVIRPDSGNPADIICGLNTSLFKNDKFFLEHEGEAKTKGVVELLWDIFGGTINKQGYKVLDPHIGTIYGDSITLDRQIEIYSRLKSKGFACTNVVLGVGSFTYQMNTRDTLGFAAKGAWFSTEDKEYDIYKAPATDDGSKKSLKGRVRVDKTETGYSVKQQCTAEEEAGGVLQVIYENGKFFNQTSLTEIRQKLDLLV